MSARSVQQRRSALGVVAMPQKLLVNGGSDRRDSHAPAGKMKLNPISLNASEMMCLFALVRGPVYSLTPPAFHSLCRSINISQLPGWPQTIIWVKQRFLRAHEGRNWRSAHNSITDAAHRIFFFFLCNFFFFKLFCFYYYAKVKPMFMDVIFHFYQHIFKNTHMLLILHMKYKSQQFSAVDFVLIFSLV